MAKPNTAGNVHQYEAAIIFNSNLDEKKVSVLLDKYLEIIKTDGGTVDKTDFWGKKTLAYPIQKETEGFYVIVNFSSKSSTTDEFARRLGLDESTLRFKVFRNEK